MCEKGKVQGGKKRGLLLLQLIKAELHLAQERVIWQSFMTRGGEGGGERRKGGKELSLEYEHSKKSYASS